LRRLIKFITVDISTYADSNAYIDEFADLDEGSVNAYFMPGHMFSITGRKIKVAGDNPDCGVFFVPEDDPSKAVRVARVGENHPSKIIGIAPETGSAQNRIEIRTQFSGANSILLKAPRVITSNFLVELAQAL
jgi:hypothetical protein